MRNTPGIILGPGGTYRRLYTCEGKPFTRSALVKVETPERKRTPVLVVIGFFALLTCLAALAGVASLVKVVGGGE